GCIAARKARPFQLPMDGVQLRARGRAQSAPTNSAARSRLLSAPDRGRAPHRCAPRTSRPCPPTTEDFASGLCLAALCLIPDPLRSYFLVSATTAPAPPAPTCFLQLAST